MIKLHISMHLLGLVKDTDRQLTTGHDEIYIYEIYGGRCKLIDF